MRLWEFDRLGGVGSQPFEVNKDGQMFVSAVLGYLWMNKEELGFDATVSSGSRSGRGRSTSTSRTITRKRSSSRVQTSMPLPKRSCSDSPVKQDA